MRRVAPLSHSKKLSRTSMRPEKAQSNCLLRTARSVRANEVQRPEKRLYFFQREKCCAHGTRIGINSSTSPCPSKSLASPEFTSNVTRAVGSALRKFSKNGTRIARSPKFQYSTTKTLCGGDSGSLRVRGEGRSGSMVFKKSSNKRISRHFRGVILRKLARAAASMSTLRMVLLHSDAITWLVPRTQSLRNVLRSGQARAF